ncbi:hypothetical protein JCM10212_003047 [Sporobolomyces blumeae]
MATPRSPRSLAELREQGREQFANFKPDEYSVRTWIHTARVAFETAERHWTEGNRDNNQAQVEEAFLDFKRAAGIMQIITKHSRYPTLALEKKSDYFSWVELQAMLNDAAAVNKKVVAWLEEREAQRKENVRTGSAVNGRTGADGSRSRSSTTGTKDSDRSVGDLIDGYGSSPPTSPRTVGHRPPAITTPSGGPIQSIAERMANLRASGASGATSTQSTSRPTAPTHSFASSARNGTTDALSTHAPPVKPPKPLGLSLNRTPPSSPRGPAGDLVEDSAVQRSGSAPPVLPQTPDGDDQMEWQKDTLQFQRGGLPIAGPSNGVVNRGPAGGVEIAPESRLPYSENDEPRTPTQFGQQFPSLDDFERRVDGSAPASDTFSFPSVPSFDPSSLPSRPPPPQPIKPPLLDRATFEREQRERAETMAKLAASLNNTSPLSGSTYPSSAASTSTLPASLIPGGAIRNQPASKASTSPRPPPTAGSSKDFAIPFSVEVRPIELYQYLQTAKAEAGEGPRVLLLDIRSRDEFEAGRIRGETVCLEPIMLRDEISSAQIEDALSLSPSTEASLFAARHHYDLVIMYDRSSSAYPKPSTNTTSDAQRVLWNLVTAIYEREFTKSLKRQPLLLRGGWEAWERQVGPAGSIGSAVQSNPSRRGSEHEDAQADLKKTNRKATVLPGSAAYPRDGSLSSNPPNPTPRQSTSISYPSSMPYPSSTTYPSSTPSYGQNFSHSVMPSGMVSPRLAMPPIAAQAPRNGSIPEYDPFVPLNSTSSYPQPRLNGYGSPPSSASPSAPIARTRSDLPDLSSYSRPQNDYSRISQDYARSSIDYPTLASRSPPAVNQALRPTRPAPAPPISQPGVPSVSLARPPLAKPAPMRSNSSFSSMHLPSYSSAHSQFPTNMSFDDSVIGLSGLKNLGNTCYMNSTIQCLSAAIPFARYFKNGAYRKDVNEYNPLGTKGALAHAVGELIRALWAQQYTYLSPVTFREAICRVAPQFRGTDQHDAQEFLGFLLDGLHEDCNYVLKKPPPIEMTPEREHDLETLPPQVMSEREWQIYKMRNDSFIVQCFQGQFRNQLRCLTCHKTSTTYNTFMPLSVPIPSHRGLHKVTLMSCLEAFVRDEILDKDDAWHCPRCKKNRKATKKLSLSKLPPILVIHLKRFSFHGPFSDKIETQVHYPVTGLDLTPFVPPPLMDQRGQTVGKSSTEGYVYDLFGVTNHYGNLSSGHYTAFVRNGRDWYNIGDSKVTPCDPTVVQSAKSAYILYYALR